MSNPALLPELDPADLETVPVERSETIPSAWYTDARFHELDRRAVFARTWQYVADLDRLKQPGDVVVTEIAGERSSRSATRPGSCTSSSMSAVIVAARWP